MKSYTIPTQGTCAKYINISVNEDGTIENVEFLGGCSGNTQGIAHLVKGMRMEEVADRLAGIRCGMKPTSCPDQLSQALKAIAALPKE